MFQTLAQIQRLGTLTFLAARALGSQATQGGTYLDGTGRESLAALLLGRRSGEVQALPGTVLVTYQAYDVPDDFAVKGHFTLKLALPQEGGAPPFRWFAPGDALPLMAFDDAADHVQFAVDALMDPAQSFGGETRLQGIRDTLHVSLAGRHLKFTAQTLHGEDALYVLLRLAREPWAEAGWTRPGLGLVDTSTALIGMPGDNVELRDAQGRTLLTYEADLTALLGGEAAYSARLEQLAGWRVAAGGRPPTG